jgi:DNA-binding transcriptional ArsR family regulator
VTARRKYEPDYPDGVVVIVIPSEARRFGFTEAGLLNQIRYWCGYHRTEWLEASSEDLADLTGLSPDAVRRNMRALIDAGAIEKERQIGSHGDRKCRYRALVKAGEIPTIGAGGESANPGGESANPGGGESADPSLHSEKQSENPPLTPPTGGDATAGGGRLFDDPPAAPDRRARKTAGKRGKVPPIQAARFEVWVTGYPKGSQRGDLQAGLRAFAKALDGGASTGELETELANYVAARNDYRAHWGAPPPLMRVATFLNGPSRIWPTGLRRRGGRGVRRRRATPRSRSWTDGGGWWPRRPKRNGRR